MKKNLLPIHILIIALSILAIWSTILWNTTDSNLWGTSLLHIFLLALGGFSVRLLVKNFISENFSARRENRIITLLILYLLFDPLLPWWFFFLIGAITETAQYFIRTQAGPLFNPAALGSLIVAFFGFLPSWWGMNPAPRYVLAGIDISIASWILFLVAIYVVYRYRKTLIIWSGIITFLIVYFVLAGNIALYLLLEGTLLFFFTVMACEPKTSPVLPKEQLVYGVLVGAITGIGLFFHFLEAALIALLLANIYTGRRFLKTWFTPKASSAPVEIAS